MRKWLFIGLSSLALISCKMVGRLTDTANELFKGEVVARVGDHRLHRSQLESYIPAGVSSEDSVGLAQQYIRAWAEDLLLLDGEPYGICVFDPAEAIRTAERYFEYDDGERYYLFFSGSSLHTAGNEDAADNRAEDAARALLEIP